MQIIKQINLNSNLGSEQSLLGTKYNDRDCICFYKTKRVRMETRAPPRMYTEPPTFDIKLEDFGTLPLRRLEAFRLLRAGHQQISNAPTPMEGVSVF